MNGAGRWRKPNLCTETSSAGIKNSLNASSKWSHCDILDGQFTDNVRNNWGPEKEYNLCKADLRGQVLGYEDNVYFINCSIHLAQWIFIVPSIFLSSFCSETFNNWIYILMSTLILRGRKICLSQQNGLIDWRWYMIFSGTTVLLKLLFYLFRRCSLFILRYYINVNSIFPIIQKIWIFSSLMYPSAKPHWQIMNYLRINIWSQCIILNLHTD